MNDDCNDAGTESSIANALRGAEQRLYTAVGRVRLAWCLPGSLVLLGLGTEPRGTVVIVPERRFQPISIVLSCVVVKHVVSCSCSAAGAGDVASQHTHFTNQSVRLEFESRITRALSLQSVSFAIVTPSKPAIAP